MAKGRILFVNQEIAPFSPENEQSLFGRYLPAKTQEIGREIRVFMPKFCEVNDRKHQLHEVIRLSGMNLIVNNCDHQLIIKAAFHVDGIRHLCDYCDIYVADDEKSIAYTVTFSGD